MSDHLCVTVVPLFNHLSLEEQRLINQVAFHNVFEKGEQIITPDSEDCLAIVARGSMKVYQLSSNGKEQLLRIVEPGGYEGENRLFGANSHHLFAEALQQTDICMIRRTDFQALLQQLPPLGRKLLMFSAKKMTILEQQSQFLMMERVEERLATYLMNLAKAEGGPHLTLPMRKKELATFLGTTPETLSRKFKLLAEKNYLTINRQQVTLLDIDGLEEMIW